jgi:hypothetical protein
MSKTFNQLTVQDPVCIRITTEMPIAASSREENAVKTLFQKTICENKVRIIDMTFETITHVGVDSSDNRTIRVKQNIYICFDKWIRDTTTIGAGAGAGAGTGVSFTGYMNEMSECFANHDIIHGDSFLYDISEQLIFDTQDWKICYYGTSIRDLL